MGEVQLVDVILGKIIRGNESKVIYMKIKLLFISLLFILFNLNVKASDGYYLSCDNDYKKINEYFNCEVNILFTHSKISFVIEYDSNVELISEEPVENWNLIKEGNTYLLEKTANNVSSSVINFRFKVKDAQRNRVHIFLRNVVIDGNNVDEFENVVKLLANNANLKNLYADGLNSLNFNQGDIEYDLLIRYDQQEIFIGCELESEYASFVNGYECNKSIPFSSDSGEIVIKVKAEDKTIKEYKINVSRENEVLDNNNYLRRLVLSSGYIDFEKDILNYEVNVPYEVDSINLYAEPESSYATYEIIGNGLLNVGQNYLTVKVMALNGDERIYNIVVNRQDKEEVVLSNNNSLKTLEIEGYDVNFQKDTLEYTLYVEKFDDLKINAIPEDEKAKVVIQGNYDLKNDDNISIIVTAENGSVKEYKIKLLEKNKEQQDDEHSKDDKGYFIYVIGGGVFLIIGGITLFVYMRKRKMKE